MPDLIGQSLGRYHIIEPLGEGGMASVYRAFDTRLETDVAVKVIRTDQFTPRMLAGALKRFEREAKSLARLTHPNIVKVTDYGDYEGQPYLVMPYLPGGTLKDRLGRKPMPWSEAVRLLIPVTHALGFAHQQGVIHRDVKPSNILITKSGEPMLSDFGIAKIMDDEATAGLTGSSMAVGTPEYMAPEQVKAKTVDARADIYALGIVFYEMVTGRRPFEADTPLAVLIKQASDPLPRPGQFVPGLPGAVEKVLFKALAKKPEDRYQTMEELAVALEKMVVTDRASAADKRKSEKAESKQKSFKETPVRTVPAVIAKKAEGQKGEPVISRPPARKIKFLPIGIGAAALLVIAGGIFGINYLITHPPVIIAPTSTITLTKMFTPTPTITVTPTPISWQRPADGMVMVYVPEGEFTMGSNDGGSNEQPVHTVYLDAFWIDQTEVTNKMYALCDAAGKCDPPYYTGSYTHSNYYGNSQFDDYPVIYVSWNDAEAYCAWTGGGAYEVHLPTEAEWEKTARGTDGRTYPWGNNFDGNIVNFCDKNCTYSWADKKFNDGYADTSQVGNFLGGASPYGALDMAGNVWEWVADWYDGTYYSTVQDGVRNPTGPSSGTFRVLRGGAWYDNDSSVRSAIRDKYDPTDSFNDVGFRCARSTAGP